MKKLFSLLILTVILSSCYEDYIKDFDYSAVYFAYQYDVRTFVVGEGMKIEFGVALGGVSENTIDRNVQFSIDGDLLTSSILATFRNGGSQKADYISEAYTDVNAVSLLPSSYYTLSDANKIVIKSGNHVGTVVMKVDSAMFLNDAASLNPNYVLPLSIVSADADSILETKRTELIGIKYENMLFGNYWHGGVTMVKDASGAPVDTILYYTEIPQADSKVWALKTVAPNALVASGYSDQNTGMGEMKLTLEGGTITIDSNKDNGAAYEVMPDGESTYNQARLLQDRKIYLSYKYQLANGNWCYAKDTLTFRNRIRDGVNEWQDENPSHYE